MLIDILIDHLRLPPITARELAAAARYLTAIARFLLEGTEAHPDAAMCVSGEPRHPDAGVERRAASRRGNARQRSGEYSVRAGILARAAGRGDGGAED